MHIVTGPYSEKHCYRLMYPKLKHNAKKHRYDWRDVYRQQIDYYEGRKGRGDA